MWYSSISDELDEIDSIISESLNLNNSELAEMCSYVLSSGGKKIRPALCILSHFACGGKSKEKILNVAAGFEIIHNATLVHDDINDKSEIRRGRKALHMRHTVSKAIIAGDLMFAIGFRLIGSSEKEVIESVVGASEAMADSEFIQKDFEHTPSVSEEDYMRIIRGKTAMPMFSSAKTGAIMARAGKDVIEKMAEYALKVGTAFQIIDDVLDVIGNPGATGKRIGADILEGKPTLPVIYGIQDPTHGKRLKEIFSDRGVDDNEADEAIGLIRKTDAVERCFAKADEIVKDACSMVDFLEPSVYKDSLVQLAEFIVKRDR